MVGDGLADAGHVSSRCALSGLVPLKEIWLVQDAAFRAQAELKREACRMVNGRPRRFDSPCHLLSRFRSSTLDKLLLEQPLKRFSCRDIRNIAGAIEACLKRSLSHLVPLQHQVGAILSEVLTRPLCVFKYGPCCSDCCGVLNEHWEGRNTRFVSWKVIILPDDFWRNQLEHVNTKMNNLGNTNGALN